MLEKIRVFLSSRKGNALGVAVIAVIGVLFVLQFGMPSEGWSSLFRGSDLKLTVNGTRFSDVELRYTMNMMATGDVTPGTPEYDALRRAAAASLIERQLLLDLAEEAGVSASLDEAESNAIKGDFFVTRPVGEVTGRLAMQLQFGRGDADQVAATLIRDGHRAALGRFVDEDGKFDVKGFTNTIRYRLGLRQDDFLEQQRRELVAQRMRAVLLAGIVIPEPEVRAAYDRQADAVTVSYVRISPAAIQQASPPRPEDITAWAQSHQDEIKKYYEANKFKYTNVEKSARARHILVKVPKDADDEVKKAAREKAEALLEQIRAGADFAALAREHSEDPGSAAKGGDLGYNPRGAMVPAFDEALFALKPGEVSDVVETEYGYHIIKLEDIREGDVSLEAATPEIAEKLYAETYGKTKAKQIAEALLSAAKTASSLDAAVAAVAPAESEEASDQAEQAQATETAAEGEPAAPRLVPEGLRLTVATSAPITRFQDTVTGIGKSRDLVRAVFSLTPQAPVADRVFEVAGNYFVVRLDSHTTPSDEEYEKKKDEIRNRLLAQRRLTWYKDTLTAMVQAAFKKGAVSSSFPLGGEATDDTPDASR